MRLYDAIRARMSATEARDELLRDAIDAELVTAAAEYHAGVEQLRDDRTPRKSTHCNSDEN